MLTIENPARQAMERLNNPPEWEFYDLRNDPIEFVNLSGEPSISSEMEKLKAAMNDWQDRTNDPFADREFRKQTERKYRSRVK